MNQINGFILILIGIVISRLMYAGQVSDFSKRKIIETQNIQLKEEKDQLKKRNDIIENELAILLKVFGKKIEKSYSRDLCFRSQFFHSL